MLSEDPSMNADLAEDLVSVREQYAQLTEEDIVTFLEVHKYSLLPTNIPSSRALEFLSLLCCGRAAWVEIICTLNAGKSFTL